MTDEGSETMKEKYDYDDKERFEYLGIAKVRFNAQGYTKVAVYRDHLERCIHMKKVPFGTVSLAWVPHYDEEENDKLWDKINAHKRSKNGYTPRPRAYIADRRPSRLLRRNRTTASRPIGLPSLKPRSYNSRSSKGTKPLSIAEVQKLVAKELGDLITGGDE